MTTPPLPPASPVTVTRRGRPRRAETAPCATRLPLPLLDALITIARAERMSVSALVREVLVFTIDVPPNIRTE